MKKIKTVPKIGANHFSSVMPYFKRQAKRKTNVQFTVIVYVRPVQNGRVNLDKLSTLTERHFGQEHLPFLSVMSFMVSRPFQ